MKNAGVLECDRRGTMVFYRLKMKCVAGFLGCVDKSLQASAKEHLEEVL
jgi:ArsR family transcriptional regulator